MLQGCGQSVDFYVHLFYPLLSVKCKGVPTVAEFFQCIIKSATQPAANSFDFTILSF